MELVLAILFGTAFGFVLQRVGAADPSKIVGMLTLRDLHLAKAILFGIGISSLLVFGANGFGILDAGHFSIKSLYWGVPVGGAVLGLGWALAGYCPGTGVVAAGAGRRDGWFFLLGGLVGAGAFMLNFGGLEKTWLFQELLGGKVSIASTGANPALLSGVVGTIVALLLAALFIGVASKLPQKLRD